MTPFSALTLLAVSALTMLAGLQERLHVKHMLRRIPKDHLCETWPGVEKLWKCRAPKVAVVVVAVAAGDMVRTLVGIQPCKDDR